ncbi:MAG TPA: hypothetical protein VEH62_07225 [Gemmatimonadales bacterium]|nr:hypothetical protein [Gemmatimonadales bacterium]
MRLALAVAALAALARPLAAQHDHGAMHPAAADSDTAWAAMQARGANVMGVDQYTSRHVFEPLADGGRIELQRAVDDSVGAAQIRRHLHEIADAFARGDFTAPALVHLQEVPGTGTMAARRALIRYDVADLPRGGELRITTTDPDALAAVHAFLAFQRREHRAPAH